METIILAAGKGTRMKSKLPKVLHKVCGKPMLQHVIDAAKSAGSSREVVVIGNGAELVKEKISGVEFVLQAEQLGTGHAVLCAKENFSASQGDLMILCGDTPLVTADLLKKLSDAHNNSQAAATVLSAELLKKLSNTKTQLTLKKIFAKSTQEFIVSTFKNFSAHFRKLKMTTRKVNIISQTR